MTWESVPFLEAAQDVSSGNAKVPKSEYLPSGALAVVDQGQGLIAGFTDDVHLVHRSTPPVIVFGDHTRAVKFVDFPFAMGADGVKVLSAQQGFDPKYLYWFLSSVDIPSAGYSRHFKFLKDITVVKPPLQEQRRIAAVLDQVDALRTKRRQSIALLEDLAQSIFLNMFDRQPSGKGRMVNLDMVLERKLSNGISPSSRGDVEAKVLTLSAVTGGSFNSSAWKVGTFTQDPTSTYAVTKNLFMVCRGNGNKRLVGKGVFADANMADTVYPDTVLAAPIRPDMITREYLTHVWSTPQVRQQIESAARTTNGTYKVNQKTMGAVTFWLPHSQEQHAFVRKVLAIRQAKRHNESHLAVLDDLFLSLQHRAFSGTLWDHEAAA
ncbi:hypothetical protein GCM10027074_43120 [Streptomyces deserti]